MSNLVKNHEESLAETLTKCFVAGEEIENGWKINFRFPGGTDAVLGFEGDEIFVEVVDIGGDSITWTGIALSDAELLLKAAIAKDAKRVEKGG